MTFYNENIISSKPLEGKPKVLIFIVAYNAEHTIENVLMCIPKHLEADYSVEVLIIDDQSNDSTVSRLENIRKNDPIKFNTHVLVNPVNQGYGGNQKIGFQFAIEHDYDYVALVHGDGQYAPECLPLLLKPLARGEAQAVFGSRMLTPFGALKGGMPIYKFIGNRVLTFFQNRILNSNLSEFHSGYRVYSVSALKMIPFHLNTPQFHFDTEIIIQFLFAGFRIKEVPIPTYYGNEICYVNGFKYAKDVAITTMKARAQNMGLFYDRKFDCTPLQSGNSHYVSKLNFDSPSLRAMSQIPAGSSVLDIGCGSGALLKELRRKKNCIVCGIDRHPTPQDDDSFTFHRCDINSEEFPVNIGTYDYVLLLDIIEHLSEPEDFIEKLCHACKFAPELRIIASTGNVAFFLLRIMLLAGQFNYGKRGILDLTHTRLFTFRSFCKLFEQAGFDVIQIQGIPAPSVLAFGDNRVSRWIMFVNRCLIRLSRSLFSYQVYLTVKPKRSLALLLRDSKGEGERRMEELYGRVLYKR